MKTFRLLVISFCLVLTVSAQAVKPRQAAIATSHYLATEAGHEILAKGGNAFDAAVAISAVLSVVEPQSSGIGGGGFYLLHRQRDGKQVMVDAREEAPGRAHRDMYLDENGEVVRDWLLNGPRAAGIPGIPAGMEHLSKNYGRLPLSEALAPAIRIAEQGFPAYPRYVEAIQRKIDVIRRYPASQKAFLINGRVPKVGETIKRPELAKTLRAIANKGSRGFYTGKVARKLVKASKKHGGIWTLQDLKNYRIKERRPIYTTYRGKRLVTAPPPSSGGIAIATMLNILSAWDLTAMADSDPAKRVHLTVEAMRRAYRDRSVYLGDPDFVDIPVKRLIHPYYADGLRASIRDDRAMPSELLPGLKQTPQGNHTTHFSIIDTEGNLVSATLTVNTSLASGFVAAGTGVLFNNEMDDFSAKPGEPNAYGLIGGEANAIAPHKRPLSSMSPTFVMDDKEVAVLGTPGGSRIITMVLLGILDFFDGHGPQSWVSLPRYHHQYLPDAIYLEPDALSPEIVSQLQQRGHRIVRMSHPWGFMNAAWWSRESGQTKAASDPRWTTGKGEVR
jgi:gamma-glutamyltranspeptidase/glutathione hydrolase